MMRAVLIAPLLWLLALPAWADARMTVLVDLMELREAAAILRDEGQIHAGTLNQDMLGGQGGPGWQMQVDTIYDSERMVEMVRQAMEERLESADLEAAIGFYSSDLGGRVIELENAARAAISDAEVEDAARARFAEIEGSDDPRLAQITRLVDAADMIDRNVTTALNSNFQFLRGLLDGGALSDSEEDLLADVGTDVDAVTEDTTAWVYAYMLLAYHPLEEAELARYADFAETEAGRALNQALFDGFGRAYEDISYALGRAVALNMTAEEL
ncbi:DUF2059 domain-containing protein [Sulfitobacter delicatus]|uniref:DUF2059 domain-containing protein n=1 Tax=Sulfitobacter delicatus TaxID=218672 RepID=A0A1G7R132_9RHOB|nr:DUF2059 domain-containing protein [Sulfitobacter delicatus]SDG04445.1 hypothetical protein SAMN04489759_104232 [Sulfitobacter delicatus]